MFFGGSLASHKLLHDSVAGMNADDFEPSRADIFEAVGNVGGHDDDITGKGPGFGVTNGELGFAFPDGP